MPSQAAQMTISPRLMAIYSSSHRQETQIKARIGMAKFQ
jgi:hypothetical protein